MLALFTQLEMWKCLTLKGAVFKKSLNLLARPCLYTPYDVFALQRSHRVGSLLSKIILLRLKTYQNLSLL